MPTETNAGKTDAPNRKRLRLEGYDYASNGAYFVTICTANRTALLWEDGAAADRPGEPPLSPLGKIVNDAINGVPLHYNNVEIDKYCIMPDHVHMTVFIRPDEDGRMISVPTLSVVVGSLKRWVSKRCGRPIWQKSFYDRVIRNERDYLKAWRYIEGNQTR